MLAKRGKGGESRTTTGDDEKAQMVIHHRKSCGIVIHSQFQPTDSPSQSDRPKQVTSMYVWWYHVSWCPPSPERSEVKPHFIATYTSTTLKRWHYFLDLTEENECLIIAYELLLRLPALYEVYPAQSTRLTSESYCYLYIVSAMPPRNFQQQSQQSDEPVTKGIHVNSPLYGCTWLTC